MNLLKRLPIRYTGELHNVQLINFSVERKEVEPLVPWKIKIRDFNGRAMISMVNVQLQHMHPTFLPESIYFNYQHIGFRLLVDDAYQNGGVHKGIYFIKSFTEKPIIAQGGRLFTDYNLETAEIIATNQMLALQQGEHYLTYALDENPPVLKDEKLKEHIGNIDRAYSILNGQIRKTQIQRETWPIQWVNCYHFRTNFFKSARLEGAFVVPETIPYEWLPPQKWR
jgi:uncharacterized protein YqjF (DUF2071 family)